MDHETKPNTSPKSDSVWSQLDTLLTDTQTRATIPTPQEVVSNIDVIVQDAERKRARQRRRRRLFVVLIVLVCTIGCVVLSVTEFLRITGRMADAFLADHPVTYTMPAAAQIIDQYTSTADNFGDFDYCATFRVSDAEYDQLLQNGFNWIYMGQGNTTPTPYVPIWRGGHLSGNGFSLSSGCFARLSASPTASQEYRYLMDDGPDFVRLLAIDEKSKIIYYYRGSW